MAMIIKCTLTASILLLCVLVVSVARLALSNEHADFAQAIFSSNNPQSPVTDPDSSDQVSQTADPDSSSPDPKTASPDSDHADPGIAGSDNSSAVPGTTNSEGSMDPSSKKATHAESKDVTLLFTGDIYLSDQVLASYGQSGIQGVLSKDMRKEFARADIVIANNEFPYSTRGTQAPDKKFTFRVDPSYVSILKEAGIDIVTLANNHVLDYGTDALTDTFQTLDDAGIDYAGAGDSLERASKLITKKAGGRTFGFLAASRVFPVVSWNVENAQPGVFSAYDPSKLLAAVQEARGQCDFLSVYVHWGIERNALPEGYQVSMAHELIDAGADVVIGAHPHVLQGVEFYHGKPIFYSLGNFIFYQSIEQTAVAKLTLTANNDAKWQLLPAAASNACTYIVSEKDACQKFYGYMTGLSTNVRFKKNGLALPGDQ